MCKKKKLQMWDQIPDSLFGHFWVAVFKNYCYIWNQHSRNCQNAKFCTKIKILKFGIKMPYLSIFEWNFEKLWLVFMSTHSNWSKGKNFVQKIKIFKFGSKNTLFWNFGVVVFKSYCHIWIDYSRFYQSELLTSTANFEIGFAFSLGPDHHFSWKFGSGFAQ